MAKTRKWLKPTFDAQSPARKAKALDIFADLVFDIIWDADAPAREKPTADAHETTQGSEPRIGFITHPAQPRRRRRRPGR